MIRNSMRTTFGASLLALGAAATLALTGCADSFNNAVTGSSNDTEGAFLSGNVHGGRQPIANSTVTVYAMGKNGYGSAGGALASTTTDLNGNFSFGPGSGHTYACPAANSPTLSQNLYIVANGGNPNGPNGSSNLTTYLMTVLQGDCTNVITTQPQININELTTVASMFALQQFFTPGSTVSGTFGSSVSNNQGVLNAIATAANLINLPSGLPVAGSTVSGPVAGYANGATVTITPEEAKIDTMADILAACVNTDGASTTSPRSTCGTLFSSVAAPAVNDTLQAAYYLALNPTSTIGTTSRITALYNLVSPTAPYQPTLSAAPSDWTLGITYGSRAAQTVAGTPVYLLTRPRNLAIDSLGNVWIDNFAGSTEGTLGNSVTELSPSGVPLKQVFTASTNLAGSSSIALDPANDVFVTSFGQTGGLGSNVLEYTAAGNTSTFTTAAGPTALTSDGAGNIFVTTASVAGGGADLEAIPANATSGTATTQLASGLTDSNLSELAVDSNGTLWLGADSAGNGTTQFLCTAGTANSAPSCAPTAVTGGSQGAVEPVAIDANNNVFVLSFSGTAGEFTKIAANANNTGFTYPTTISSTTDAALNSLQKVAIDGAGHVWTSNSAASPSTVNGVSEFGNAGFLFSPNLVTGFAHTYSGADKIAIDGSGNVWVGNGGSAAIASSTTNGFITEIVGQAAPVVTPIAAGLPAVAGGVNRLGTRP